MNGDHEGTATQLMNALADLYPDAGAPYVAALRAAGYTDDQIVADYRTHVQHQPTEGDFIAALRRRATEETTQ